MSDNIVQVDFSRRNDRVPAAPPIGIARRQRIIERRSSDIAGLFRNQSQRTSPSRARSSLAKGRCNLSILESKLRNGRRDCPRPGPA
jgi:hypothetical protein